MIHKITQFCNGMAGITLILKFHHIGLWDEGGALRADRGAEERRGRQGDED